MDQYGQPVRTGQLGKVLAAPSTASIRNPWMDQVAAHLTPSRLAGVLRAAAQGDAESFLGLAEEMEERDLHYASVLGTRKRAIAGVAGVVRAASDSVRDQEIMDKVQELVETPAFSRLRDELCDALGKGYCVSEIIWERGAIWRPVDYCWRDPRHFVFDRETGQRLLLRDDSAPEGMALEPFKFICHVPRLKCGLPIRGGLARLAALGVLCKSFTIKDWMGFLEVYGMPLRIGRYGAGATAEDIDVLVRAVSNIGTDAAAIMPESMQIEFVEAAKGSSSSGGAVIFKDTAEWWDRQLSKGILGQTASAEGTAGKLGADDTQEEVRQDILRSDAKQLAETINRDLIRVFVDLNFGAQARYPQFLLPVEDKEDVSALVGALKELVPLGLRVSEREVRARLGLSEPEDGEAILSVAEPHSAERTAQNRTALQRQSAAQGAVQLNSLEAFEELLGEIEQRALDSQDEQLKGLLNPLMELVSEAQDYEAVLAGLGPLLKQMDSGPLREALAQAGVLARAGADG